MTRSSCVGPVGYPTPQCVAALAEKKRRREMWVIFGIPKNLATVILVDGRNLEPPGISVKTYKIVKKKSYQASVVNARFLNHQYLLDGAFKRSHPPKLFDAISLPI